MTNPKVSPVTPVTMRKLEEAMDRLLAGRPRRTDGALTKNNLYVEAGVSRATMNRASELLARWEAAVGENEKGRAEPLRDGETLRLRRELREARADARGLRQDLAAAATVIQALHAENVNLRQKLERMTKKVPKLTRKDRLSTVGRSRQGPSP